MVCGWKQALETLYVEIIQKIIQEEIWRQNKETRWSNIFSLQERCTFKGLQQTTRLSSDLELITRHLWNICSVFTLWYQRLLRYWRERIRIPKVPPPPTTRTTILIKLGAPRHFFPLLSHSPPKGFFKIGIFFLLGITAQTLKGSSTGAKF